MGEKEDALQASLLVERLREEFLPVVQQLGETLPRRFADREFFVYSMASYQGHDIGIECGIPNLTEWDQMAVLVFELSKLTAVPQLSASVYWNIGGHERDFPDPSISNSGSLDATDTSFAELREKLPGLVADFVAAVERGHP